MINGYVCARKSLQSITTLNKNDIGPIFFSQIKCLKYVNIIFMILYFSWIFRLSDQSLDFVILDKKTVLDRNA